MASVSTIVEVLNVLLTWAENNETLVLAMITTVSVLVSSFWSKRMIEENSDLVEANKDAIEQTRRDHRRESVKDLIIQLDDLRKDIPRPRTQTFSSGPYSVGRAFRKLDEWEMEIPNHLRRFIREETTSDSPDLLSEYDDYKSNYKEYNNKYKSLKREISSFVGVYYDEVDWPETRSVNPDIPLQSGPSMTIDEAKQKLRNESEKIAENILTKGMVFQGRKNTDLSKAVYDLVEDQYREDFDYLHEEPYNLRDQSENLTRPTSQFRSGYIGLFIEHLRNEYSIPVVEIAQQREEQESTNEQSKSLINAIENQTMNVSVNNEDTISRGKIYLKHAEYDKDRDDINPDDYDSFEEYADTLEKETPGISYDSIEILANSWVRCINEVRGEKEYGFKDGEMIKKFIHIYPLDAIEKIQHSTTRTRELDK